jgi:hypothetical protein
MPKEPPARLKKVSVGLPFGMGQAEWQADDTEIRAAWNLYVELVTRVAVEALDEQNGSLREALNSLYQLFPQTREILRTAGPSIGARMPSIGGLAIAVLNDGLRPFMTKWHPELAHWESQRPATTSPRDHERSFPGARALREDLRVLQIELRRYAEALGRISGASS